jgi:hypothetical protein
LLEDFVATAKFDSNDKIGDCATYVIKKVNATALGYPSFGLLQKRDSGSPSVADSFMYGWKLVHKATDASNTGSRQQITFTMTSTVDFTSNYGLASGAVYAAKCEYYNYTIQGDASTAVLDSDMVTTVSQRFHANGTFTLTCKITSMGDYVIAAVPSSSTPTPSGTDTPQRNDGGGGASSANSLLWILLVIPGIIL